MHGRCGASRVIQRRRELRAAFDQGQIQAHFQPQVDLRSHRPVGLESLARWIHPDRGTVPGVELVPLVAQCGLLGELTRTMLLQAAVALRACSAAGHPLDVSLNLSALDLGDDDVVADLEQAVVGLADEPGRLVLELTEDTALADRRRAAEVLGRLRHLGARTSADDYGTGHATLTYLLELPLDELKIDRSFVRGGTADPRSAALTRSTIALARELGIHTVAEGVEDHATDRWLAGLGCDAAQGYLYAPPMPLSRVLQWLGAPVGASAASSPTSCGATANLAP